MMSFEVGVVHKRQPHLLADLAELILLAQYCSHNEISKAQLQLLTKELPASAEELEENSADQGNHSIDQHESADVYIEDCWAQLEYRQIVFGAFYPFVVTGEMLEWKQGIRTSRECLYCFLLVCSRLRSFKGVSGFVQRAARTFAEMSKIALEALGSPSAVVRIFDANSWDRQTYYGTDLRVAMKKLASDLGAHNVSHAEIDSLSASGDYGLDLVAIDQFSDGATGNLAFFGQCGAQEIEWPSKTLEAHPLAFRGLFNCLHDPANLMFIPVSYRDTTGAWVAGHKTSGCLLIDRLRILTLAGKHWVAADIKVQARCYPLLGEIVGLAASP